jgi:hypothetical protein
MVEKTVSLLKSPFLLRQLMLRATTGSLLDDDVGVCLAFRDSPNALQLEVLALRRQLQVLQRTRPRRLRREHT